ncbi:DUF1453 domain-containing protein [Streptomyces triticagri]|uniref:DUF1453 domain-containing protein n=1 Tax=Streptomyces triticagri TaxID=2293568 RepID=A0A372M0G0_9ACTN|nr:DUF1453 domain-containing protein [Streptomyces triticagri]RFU84434.1 DUF1453 domain-containing protein [Streptomyces triticagri]
MSQGFVLVAGLGLAAWLQFRPQRLSAEFMHGWLLPAALVLAAVRGGGPVDSGRPSLSVLLLVAGSVTGLVAGGLWARTSDVWVDLSGAAWSRARGRTALVWAGAVAVGAGLSGITVLAGVQQGAEAAMLALAAALVARTAVVALRAGPWRGSGGRAAAA